MSSIRRGLAITTVERQLTFAIQIVVTMTVSRLLTPAEVGVWAIAFAATTLLLGAREFATETYLIQRPNLEQEEARAAFTVMLLVNVLIFLVLVLAAPLLGRFYGEQGLSTVVQIVAVAVLLEVIAAPLIGLMRRHMAFGDVAIVTIVRGVTAAAVTMSLAALGYSFFSFAWGWLAATLLSTILAVYLRPDTWIFKPRFQGWREMLTFGGYSGINLLLYKVYETLPAFLLGRVWSFEAVGIYNRATLICQIPNNILLNGVGSVLLPALAAEVRAGNSLRAAFLRGASILTAFQWPALMVLAILAHSLVSILLGSQWLQTVPLIQIMAIAALPTFLTELAFPVLVATGAMRDLMFRALLSWPLSALIIAAAAQFGLLAAALSFFLIFPLQALISFHFVRKHLTVGWRDVGEACWRSVVVTAASMAGPLAIMTWWGFEAGPPIPLALLAAALAAAGWLAGLWCTRHELVDELARVADLGKRLGIRGRPTDD